MVRRFVLIAAAATMCACSPPVPATPVPQPSSGPSATASCGPVASFPIQGEGHLVGDQEPPVPYNSTPPTSGWHTSGDVAIAVAPANDPLSEGEQVTVLELGGVVISHGDLANEDRAALEQLVRDEYAGQAALTRYDKLRNGEVALTAWGHAQRCNAVDEDAVAAFVSYYAQR